MTKNLVWYLVPRLRDVLFSILFVGVLLLGTRFLNIDSDLGVHLTTGEYILTSRSVPTVDLFSYTKPGEARPSYAWLTELFFAIAFRVADLDAVIWLCALIIAFSFSVVFYDALMRSGYPLLSLILTLLAAVTSSIHWLPRPHLFTFLFLAAWLAYLDSNQRARRIPIWIFPLIMLLWANMHGGFIFGFAAWFVYLAGPLLEGLFLKKSPFHLESTNLLMIGLLSFVATLLTPGGLDNWRAVLGNSNAYLTSHTVETQPPSFSHPSTWILLLFLLSGILFAIKKEMNATYILLFAGFGGLSLFIARVIPLFMVAAAPILSGTIGSSLRNLKTWSSFEDRVVVVQSKLRGVIWPLVVVFGSMLLIGISRSITKHPLYNFDSGIFPVQAVDWLETYPQAGNMFNDIDWSGYILHRLWPAQRVFIDSRTDFYGEPMLRTYEKIITAAPDWMDLLHQYNVKWVLIKMDTPLANALQDAGWHQLYRDSLSVIFRTPNPQ